MRKQVYEIDISGHLKEIYVTEVIDGVIQDEKFKSFIVEDPIGIFKPKWNGTKWTEGATPEEIVELTKPQPHVPTDSEILGQQMTERELEAIVQGQQITDMDLRLFMVEMGANQ